VPLLDPLIEGPQPFWPLAAAPLDPPAIAWPADFGTHRIVVDAGHGSSGNTGTTSAFCESEQDFTLRVAEDLAKRLEATGHFEVRLARSPGDATSYGARVSAADAWPAEAFVSLHADAREIATDWEPTPGQHCPRRDDEPGFAVLYSDDAPARTDRRSLAVALAERLADAGFTPYNGIGYTGGIWKAAADAPPGVFADGTKHAYVLSHPAIPSVIVETHHAWDVEEDTRWTEPRTLEVFAAATAAALVDFLAPLAPAAAAGH
jgi:N-acetylmuramoyl-L-alanine amidase